MSETDNQVDVEYLRFAARELAHIKQRSYSFMQIQPGNRILDVGCGAGYDTLALVPFLGGTGQIVGVDNNTNMILKATELSIESGIEHHVIHLTADAYLLPFANGYFDSCRCERLLQYLENPEIAILEMVRVTKAGGWVIVLDADWGGLSIDTDEIEIELKLSRFRTEHFVSNGRSGRKLYRQLKRCGLKDVSTEIFPTQMTSYTFARRALRLDKVEEQALQEGFITSAELMIWQSYLRRADESGVFFAYLNLILVAGRKE